MPAKKFRFVSPGVQIKEIDRSQLARTPEAVGPVVIGRTIRGPGMVPVTVRDYREFEEKFGAPDRGAGNDDVWRNGNTTAPTYASYAAQAWLANGSPLTMVRLLGTQNTNAQVGAGEAGWSTKNASPASVSANNGGAYGLFMIASSSAAEVDGTLAAIIYVDEGSLALVGEEAGGTLIVTGSSTLVKNVGADKELKMQIKNGAGATSLVSFNFNRSSSKYIRKVLNTNPTLTNSAVTPSTSLKSYWLGESFETNLKEVLPGTANVFAFLAPMQRDGKNYANHKGVEAQPSKSGWIISQDLSALYDQHNAADMPKLFRFVAGEGLGGDWEQNNLKISISDIKPSPTEFEKFGTFTVSIRTLSDKDSERENVEVYTNCNLNPKSGNYIAARIGDRHLVWDETEKRHKEVGDHANVSQYVRVEMNPVIEQGGLDPELLPFGFFGPPKPADIVMLSGSSGSLDGFMQLGTEANDPEATSAGLNCGGITDLTASITFPEAKMRVSASDAGVTNYTQAFYGVVPNLGDNLPLKIVNEDYRDLMRAKPYEVDSYEADTNAGTINSVVFTLDDVVVTGATGEEPHIFWKEGSRRAGESYSSLISGAKDFLESEEAGSDVFAAADYSYKNTLAKEINKFTLPLFGGTDGLDIKEREPFRNSLLLEKSAAESYAVHSLRRAIDTIKDPEVLDMNLLVVPGVTDPGITNHAISTCENRADALAIIDLPGGYEAAAENNSPEKDRLGSVKQTVNSLKQRNLNSSYACAYYPWVKATDSESGAGVWLPPSIAALGTMAYSQAVSAVWFAPAGFNRGGLSLGSSGLDVLSVRESLTSKQRDSLYEVNINPIASFPSEGIVIFGQKTLQAVPSALDRINVRRLVLFVKKQISRVASGLLFEQNVQNTWNRFKGQAEPILDAIRAGNGISEYKIVLDSTTTTPEEIDRNMMYAKLFIKPVYAIEFIGIDFVITNTGASFEDL